jgi:pilus assembly protein CpaE
MSELVAAIVIADRQLREEVRGCLREVLVRIPIDESAVGDLATFHKRLNLVRPDVLVVELNGPPERAQEYLKSLRPAEGGPAVIAVQTTAQPDAIIAAMRAGAVEYLYPPFDDRLRLALQRVWVNRAHGGAVSPGKTLAFLSSKGGCGATTIACHLAAALQRQTEQRILLADFDMNAGMIRFYLKTKCPYSVLDAASNVQRLDLSFWQALIANGTPRLEVIAAPVTVPTAPIEPASFRHVVRFARNQYDWVLADLGRGLTPFSLSVLKEIDEIFVVTTLDVPALYQARQVFEALVDRGFSRYSLRLIVNRMPKDEEVPPEDIERVVGQPVYAVVPNEYRALADAYAEGRLVGPKGNLGTRFTHLAAKIAGLPGGESKAKRNRFLSLFEAA